MTEHKTDFPQFYVTAPQPCPYLPGKLERKLFTHLTRSRPKTLVDNLLKGGFRRSQNIAYMPYCEGCSACIPVRILVDEFEPRRSLKRLWRSNFDISASRTGPVPTSEQYSIFRAYLDERHHDGGMADMSVLDYAMMVEDSAVSTHLTEYRLRPHEGVLDTQDTEEKGKLIAVALTDQLGDGISMVYSFYEPLLVKRSLGSYMIMEHVEHARRLGLPYVYLGYWIDGSRKMEYKTRFQPQEKLTPSGWVRF